MEMSCLLLQANPQLTAKNFTSDEAIQEKIEAHKQSRLSQELAKLALKVRQLENNH